MRTDSRFYIWDDPLLFKRGANMIIRRCVPESEQGKILQECHCWTKRHIQIYSRITKGLLSNPRQRRHKTCWTKRHIQIYSTITKGLLSNPRQRRHKTCWTKTPIQIYELLPKDYYLVPSNKTIKLECGFP